MQLVEKTRSALRLRMDDRRQRILVEADDGEPVFFGWEVPDGAALERLAARLEAAGVPVERLPRRLAEARRVRDAVRFADPAGNRLEAFHGAELATDTFRPGRAISGFRTGPLGMGHVVLTVENIDAARPFYQNLLGFRLRDYVLKLFRAFFFQLNPRHHSLATTGAP